MMPFNRPETGPGISPNKKIVRPFFGQDEDDEEQNWLVTFSDLLSLLLIFFIAFGAWSKVSTLHRQTTPPASSKAEAQAAGREVFQTVKTELQALLLNLGMGEGVTVQTGPQEILITLKEYISFANGQAEVLETSYPVLDTIADALKRCPDFLIEIDGHTDDRPIKTVRFPSNWELSMARAAGVLRYLIDRHGLDPSRFTLKGHGEQRPLVPNDTEAHRAQNRRVEIRLKNPGLNAA